MFIHVHNRIYIASDTFPSVQVFSLNKSHTYKIYCNHALASSWSLFVNIEGNTFWEEGARKRVLMCNPQTNTSVIVMHVSGSCSGLFVDLNGSVYCSIQSEHRVVRGRIDNPNVTETVAGTGTSGSGPMYLNQPREIFVHANFTLYVVDSGNNRIQRFLPGNRTGDTICLDGPDGRLTLNWPTDVKMDADGYLFIMDSSNRRIIGSDARGFRCVIGCALASSCSNMDQLAFDNIGNIYVPCSGQGTIFKYSFLHNSCGEKNWWSRMYMRIFANYPCRYNHGNWAWCDESNTDNCG